MSPTALPTGKGNPTAALPKSFAGFRFGASLDEVSRTCRAHAYALGDVEQDGDLVDIRCDGVPVAEPGIVGDFVYVGLCRGAVCQISIHAETEPAARYRKALDALTKQHGRPSDFMSTPLVSEEAAVRTCAGDAPIASTTWSWGDGFVGRIELELHCLDRKPL